MFDGSIFLQEKVKTFMHIYWWLSLDGHLTGYDFTHCRCSLQAPAQLNGVPAPSRKVVSGDRGRDSHYC